MPPLNDAQMYHAIECVRKSLATSQDPFVNAFLVRAHPPQLHAEDSVHVVPVPLSKDNPYRRGLWGLNVRDYIEEGNMVDIHKVGPFGKESSHAYAFLICSDYETLDVNMNFNLFSVDEPGPQLKGDILIILSDEDGNLIDAEDKAPQSPIKEVVSRFNLNTQ
ncbi:hypothetical protein CC1G_12597 [Coprinopsis cinerea okayama7|uniref:Uncharacterized protein n=1 Tax=Coprinopsis cinerea (strain Okayama-7 / 130 / ATCC MYA-4618 / FGSC 9003) TaxID=240176 RepID=A8P9L0_COPC7|nr:hypothetical protein CC1G_12597 [Coprinopsis cinerea okayama7\|eukprot:XP_001839795.2 hypothetical protein CC1G_12597 [Coprinopsis cinerea okayama7\